MVTKRNRFEDRVAPKPSDSPIEDQGVRRQLAQLFGESLFGPWPELERNKAGPWRRSASKVWLWRLSIAALVVVVVWGGRALLRSGMKRQVDDHRAGYAQELQSFINDGDLQRAAQFLPLVTAVPGAAAQGSEIRSIEAKDPHLDLIVGAEATLYRCYDADPERLRQIRPFLDDSGQASPLRFIASLTVQSREERAAKLPEIERLRNDLPNNNELEYLLATALTVRGDTALAREAWQRSARLGPAWLGHRFEQAWFELHATGKLAAQGIARQMVRIDPDSPWTTLAVVTFELEKNPRAESVRGDAAAPIATPVGIFFDELQQCLAAARRGDSGPAKEHLTRAAAAIHQQPPFLLDAFDWFVVEKQLALARTLTQLPEWPRDSSVATAKLARLPKLAP
jgi:hypothetical protein